MRNIFSRRRLPGGKTRPLPVPMRLMLGLVLLVSLGTIALMLPISGGTQPLTWNQALFTATSALSVTGLTIIEPGEDLSRFGQVVLLLLIQLGGIGFMVGAVLVLLLLGRRISLIDRLALSDSLGLLAPAAIVRLAMRVLVTVIVIEAIATAILYLHWRNDARLSDGEAAFYALFHAISAFCNAGFNLFGGTPGYPEGIPRDTLSLVVFGALIFMGSLGIPVLGDLFVFWRTRRFSLHTRITLRVAIFLLLFGALNIGLAEQRAGASLAEESLSRLVLISIFQSISARSGGFDGIADTDAISEASQVLLTALMFIGGSPASMGGGITTGTFAALTISLWSYARGHHQAQFGRRTLAVGTMRKAAAVLTISLFVITFSVWLILITHDAPIDIVVFEVVSAFATCGLSMGMTSQLNLFGQILICFMMFWGRLGALTIIVIIAQPRTRHDLVQYPEEQILIG